MKTWIWLLFVLLAMPCSLPLRAQEADSPPLRLRISLLEILEIRSQRDIAAYRLVVDGQEMQEAVIAEKGIRRVWMGIDPSQRYTVSLNFGDRRHAVLFPDFAGIENQCSHSRRDLPPGQTVDPAGWTSIYRLTVFDPCQKRQTAFEVQIRGLSRS